MVNGEGSRVVPVCEVKTNLNRKGGANGGQHSMHRSHVNRKPCTTFYKNKENHLMRQSQLARLKAKITAKPVPDLPPEVNPYLARSIIHSQESQGKESVVEESMVLMGDRQAVQP